MKEAKYPNVREFYLHYEEGTTSEDTGPNIIGYELTNLCSECAWKLVDKLNDLGILVERIAT